MENRVWREYSPAWGQSARSLTHAMAIFYHRTSGTVWALGWLGKGRLMAAQTHLFWPEEGGVQGLGLILAKQHRVVWGRVGSLWVPADVGVAD